MGVGDSDSSLPHASSERSNPLEPLRDAFRAFRPRSSWPGVSRITGVRESIGRLSTARWIALVVGVGLALRLALGPLTAQTDLETYAESSTTMAFGGGPYTYLIVYPPGWIYILNLIGRFVEIFVPADGILVQGPGVLTLFLLYGGIFPSALNVVAYSIAEKSILWFADLGMSCLLYGIVREATGDQRTARSAFALWFVNPLVITVSAVHGGYDVLPSFFALGSVYLLIRGYALSSGAALGAGVLLKIFPIFLLGLLLGLLWLHCERSPTRTLRTGGAWATGFGATLALALWPPGVLGQYLVGLTTGPSVGAAFGGFWIFSLTGLPLPTSTGTWLSYNGGLVFEIAGLVTAGLLAVIAVLFTRKNASNSTMSVGAAYAGMASMLVGYTSFEVVQPQYLLWVVPWIILVACLDRRLLSACLWVSSIPVVFYAIGLEGPYDLLLPVAQFTRWLSFATVETSVRAWQPDLLALRAVTTIAVFVVLAYALVRSVRELLRPRGSPS